MSLSTSLHQQHQQEQHAKLIVPPWHFEKAVKSDGLFHSVCDLL